MDLQVVGAAAFWLVCAEAQVREAHHLRNRRGLVGVGLSSVVEAQGLVMVQEAEVPVEALVVEVVQVVVVEVAMAGVEVAVEAFAAIAARVVVERKETGAGRAMKLAVTVARGMVDRGSRACPTIGSSSYWLLGYTCDLGTRSSAQE